MTAQERLRVRVARDRAVRQHLTLTRECGHCEMELALDAFGDGQRWCLNCKAEAMRLVRAGRRAA